MSKTLWALISLLAAFSNTATCLYQADKHFSALTIKTVTHNPLVLLMLGFVHNRRSRAAGCTWPPPLGRNKYWAGNKRAFDLEARVPPAKREQETEKAVRAFGDVRLTAERHSGWGREICSNVAVSQSPQTVSPPWMWLPVSKCKEQNRYHSKLICLKRRECSYLNSWLPPTLHKSDTSVTGITPISTYVNVGEMQNCVGKLHCTKCCATW